ncbi:MULTISPECIES: transglycosylase family protein [unclassified Streptomyces]|uniref:transglycosylase family protein n=1 Tax=Streptomyces TaxID=1883 RepID=UPI0001C1BDA2|nr:MULTISPECIES: transglycosylase family protein [unclassified Streptomyces]AEN10446.1 Transglycosylase domain protein [Streptomyces sp. SirexAA-E]MYR70397.1 LysM peptidoglycan-binding domain-containing protein [Streptomyces sp. SID4939]MYS03096.1 LysM peptidoglycan-binding domain-containing protein [Streptomyces sp. SID4940]MYT62365.1 LysM peptidoglycan-binding domain-containing protein [Streptomyces sp. SID8357]MYT83839.1 LysM peptidoglycan-binding domain-containing protein [Streptomyces sp.
MGSANGRHRRPRQAPAIVVTAGVTGSAIAIPLLGATGAHAADASTWDRVAECESGGMWSADLGNGSYGGLQFSQDTWMDFGGTAYAPRADLASRSQQIAVAEKVLDAKGPQAWPSCAVISGLVVDGALPGVDPGGDTATEETATPSPEATDGASDEASDGSEGKAKDKATDEPSDDATGSTDKGGTDASDGADGSTGRENSAPSASPSTTTPSPEATGTPGTSQGTPGGKHRGAPAPEAGTPGSEETGGREAGRHASRGDSGAREGAGTAADGSYTVQEGDNLWAIAEAQELPGGWTALYAANKEEVGSDPDLILPGQSLDLTPAADAGDASAQDGAATTGS